MKRIIQCRVCKRRKIKEFLDLGNQPYANALLKSPNEKEKLYPLSLSYCLHCSLVQLNHTADPKELFSNYVWVTSTSSTARKHANGFCNEVIKRIESKKGYILELASNDGTFLRPFVKKGYNVLGIDPAKNIVDMAVAKGIPTRCEFFGTASARKLKNDIGPAKVVIARNVLPHVADTHDFVKGMRDIIDNNGLLVLEIHYAKKINQQLHYDSVYHEHLCYFTIKSLEKLLNMYGFYIQDIKTSPISGGSLIVFARKKKVKESLVVGSYKKAEEKMKLNTIESWRNFAERVKNHKRKLLEILHKNSKSLIMGYGASARSSTLLNYCGINTAQLPLIADQNSWKQGLYTAGTHILIQSPDLVMKKNPDFILILAWNFKGEITKILKDRYHYQGKYIIPLPYYPKVLR